MYHTRVFDKLDPKKKQRILDVAKAEFADKGYTGANVNVIAEKANISVGAIYKYFETKENLFLTIIDGAFEVLEDTLRPIAEMEGSIFSKIEALFRAAWAGSLEEQELVRIYIDCTTEGLAPLAGRLSRRLESMTADLYSALLEEARSRGEIAQDVDPRIGAFFVDNLLLILQYSAASAYYRERFALFTGKSVDETIDGLLYLVRRALAPER